MLTRWGETLDKNNVLGEYPRPQMRRSIVYQPQRIVGLCFHRRRREAAGQVVWENTRPLLPRVASCPASGALCVPDEYLWYRRDWAKPDVAEGDRVILHFGAVDQSCTVYINGLRALSPQGRLSAV